MTPWVGLVGLLVVGQAGPVRHELGVHLRQMEATLKDVTDPGVREKAIPVLKDTTMLYFTAQFGKAAQLLDQARHQLKGEFLVDPEIAWAEALAIRLSPKLVEAGVTKLNIQVEAFYPGGKAPVQPQLLLENLDLKKMTPPIDLKELPHSGTVPAALIPGVQRIVAKVVSGKKVLATRELVLFAKKDLASGLKAIKDTLEAKKEKKDLGWWTLEHLETILSTLAKGEILETDYPQDRLWAQAESIMAAMKAGKSWPEKPLGPGEYWLALPEPIAPRVVRVGIPEKGFQEGAKMPLVMALHGAGGSENLFFDGYGVGEVVRQSHGRGWIVVSPKLAAGAKTLEQLAAILPMDLQKVVMVGHSMGSAQASGFASLNPQKLKGVAYLGGGGRVGKGDEYKELPAFVGVGKLDFALGSAKGLYKGMQTAGVKKTILKEYPNIEHLTIVQVALPDVFKFFDEVLEKK